MSLTRTLFASVIVGIALFSSSCEPAAPGALPAGPNAVEVTIDVEPASGTLIVDGVPQGAGPRTLKLNPGPHTLKAALSGYFPTEQRIVVSSDGEKNFKLSLVASH